MVSAGTSSPMSVELCQLIENLSLHPEQGRREEQVVLESYDLGTNNNTTTVMTCPIPCFFKEQTLENEDQHLLTLKNIDFSSRSNTTSTMN